jgi:biofilm protein TabA
MILDRLEQAKRCMVLHPRLKAGFDFLLGRDLAKCPLGRYEIQGSQIYATVSADMGQGREQSPLEAHREYIDIQYVIEGDEWIGWDSVGPQLQIRDPYDPSRDILFFKNKPASWVQVPPGCFAVLFPEDAHAPLAGQGPVLKVVVKVAIR